MEGLPALISIKFRRCPQDSEDSHVPLSWLVLLSGQGVQHLHALDMFGLSRAVERCWRRNHYKCVALDIKLGGQDHDILYKGGFFHYMDLAMQ